MRRVAARRMGRGRGGAAASLRSLLLLPLLLALAAAAAAPVAGAAAGEWEGQDVMCAWRVWGRHRYSTQETHACIIQPSPLLTRLYHSPTAEEGKGDCGCQTPSRDAKSSSPSASADAAAAASSSKGAPAGITDDMVFIEGACTRFLVLSFFFYGIGPRPSAPPPHSPPLTTDPHEPPCFCYRRAVLHGHGAAYHPSGRGGAPAARARLLLLPRPLRRTCLPCLALPVRLPDLHGRRHMHPGPNHPLHST
jgi:hypothetical protein